MHKCCSLVPRLYRLQYEKQIKAGYEARNVELGCHPHFVCRNVVASLPGFYCLQYEKQTASDWGDNEPGKMLTWEDTWHKDGCMCSQ